MADSTSTIEIADEEAATREEEVMADSTLLPASKAPSDSTPDNASESDTEDDHVVRVEETSLRAIVVVAAIFSINVIASGIMRSYGLIIDELIFQLDTTTEGVGLAIGLYNGFGFGLAPLIAPLTKHVSWMMPMMLGGSMMIGVALSLAAISPNIICFSVLMGTAGIGYSFVATLTFIVFSEYFRKHFALAFGISDIGCALGVLLTLIAEKLVDVYGWRGTILIFGGIQFNTLVACALMPDPRARRKRKRKADDSAGLRDSEDGHSCANAEEVEETVCRARYTALRAESDVDANGSLTRTPGQSASDGNIAGSLAGSVCNGGVEERVRLNEDCAVTMCESSDGAEAIETSQGSTAMTCGKRKNPILKPFLWLWTTLDWSLCYDEPYLNFILLATLMVGVLISGFYIFLIPHAIAKGITVSQAVMLSIATGVGDAFGNVCQGPIIDRGWMSSTGLFMLLAGINGCLFFLDPVIEGVVGLTFCSLCIGICNGGQMTVTLVALKEATPPPRFATAFGLSSIASGLSNIIGGFSAGWIVSRFGYESLYLYIGGVSILTVLLLIPASYHYRNRRGDAAGREKLK